MKPAISRPRFLTLWQIRLPLPGLVSILHRLSGVVLFLALPFVLYLLQLSLASEAGFARAAAIISSWPLRLLGLLLLWLFLHHLFAGVRFLLIDLEWGSDLPTARRTALVVLLGAVVLSLFGGLL